MSRNHSTTIFLVNEHVRAIACAYEEIDMSKDTTKMKYTPAYLSGASLPKSAAIFKTMNKDIKVGDFVTVPTETRVGMTVCKVIAIDVEIDFESDKECHWIVGTVDTTGFEEVRQWEERVIIAVKKSDVTQKREVLGAELKASMGDNIPQLGAPTTTEDSTGNKGNGKE